MPDSGITGTSMPETYVMLPHMPSLLDILSNDNLFSIISKAWLVYNRQIKTHLATEPAYSF